MCFLDGKGICREGLVPPCQWGCGEEDCTEVGLKQMIFRAAEPQMICPPAASWILVITIEALCGVLPRTSDLPEAARPRETSQPGVGLGEHKCQLGKHVKATKAFCTDDQLGS